MEKKNVLNKGSVVTVLAVCCCLLWGSAFPSIKIGYGLFDIVDSTPGTYILFAGMRFVIAGILALIIGSVAQKKLLMPKPTSWGMVMKLSFFQTIGQYLFFYIGIANTSGVRSSIISGMNVFIALMISVFIFHLEDFTLRKAAGCISGFLGGVLISLNGSSMGGSVTLMGEGFMFFAMICSGFSANLASIYGKKDDPWTLSAWQFAFGGLVLIAIGLLMGGRIAEWSWKGIALLTYLGFISAVAYSIWGMLLKHNPVSRVLVWGCMTPVFGVILSAIFLGEKNQAFTLTGLMSLLLVCAGIAVVNTAKGPKNP